MLKLARADTMLSNAKVQVCDHDFDREKVDVQVQTDVEGDDSNKDKADADASFCLPIRQNSKDVEAEIEALQDQVSSKVFLSNSNVDLLSFVADRESVVCIRGRVDPSW